MKIVCDSCSTKYSIADDKVRGKVFKIRCKKCSHIIVVRGTEGAPAPAEAPAGAPEGWHLVIDGDQVGPISDSEVKERFQRGEINADTYIWKEGFADWLKLSAVPEFAPLMPAGGPFGDSSGATDTNDVDPRLGSLSGGDLAGTPAPIAAAEAVPSFFGSGRAGQEAARVASQAVVAGTASSSPSGRAGLGAGAESDVFAAPAPAAVAHGEGLFAPSLVSSPAPASVTNGWAGSAPMNGAAGGHDGGRVENLTAQRSENSVLFSLSNLQSLAAPAPVRGPSTPSNTEGSGLIDIRAMAATTLKPTGPSSAGLPGGLAAPTAGGLDDLPAFGTTFGSAAPVLLPMQSSSGPPKWVWAILGVVVLLVGAIVFMAWSVLSSKPVVQTVVAPPPPAATAPVAAAPAVQPPAAPAPPASKTLPESELPPREDPAGAKAPHQPHVAKERHAGAGKEKGAGEGKEAKESKESKTVAVVDDAPKPKKGSLDDLLDGALNGKKSGAGSEGKRSSATVSAEPAAPAASGPLSKAAVVAGMNSVKAKVQSCYDQFKVPGMAMVNVVIAKNGSVSSSSVTGKFAGTPTGTCVEKAVKTAKFPPSDGLTTPYPFNLR